MPIPPLWFGAAAFALLGVFVDPAFYVIGAGATAACAGLIASSPRFQRTVDAAGREPPMDEQDSLLTRLDPASRERQAKLESQCTELQRVLESANAGSEHINGVWQRGAGRGGLGRRRFPRRAGQAAVGPDRGPAAAAV
jgi:hypothetical protein